MANNIDVKDAAGVTKTMKTTDDGFGVHTPHHVVDSSALPTGAATEDTLAAIEALLGGTQYTEDAAAAANPVGNMLMAVRADSLSAVTDANGDNIALRATNNGEIWTRPVGKFGTDIDDLYLLLNSGIRMYGEVAHDNVISGFGINPVLMGGYASATAPTEVSANGDAVRAWFLRNGAQVTVQAPSTSGGLSIGKKISGASTNATSLKASAGQVYSIYAHNTNAAVRYLKLYNKASSPTVGTDTPVMTLPIPGSTAGNGFVLDTGGLGVEFATGIAYALTTGVADSDTGAVAADEIVLTILYK